LYYLVDSALFHQIIYLILIFFSNPIILHLPT